MLVRLITLFIGGLLLFLLQNSPDDISSNACKWITEISGSCPPQIASPQWDVILSVVAGGIIAYSVWPLMRRVIPALFAIPPLILQLFERTMQRLKRVARVAVVTAIEETTGKQLYVGVRDAKDIVRNSKIGRNAYKLGQPEPSGLGGFLSAVGSFGTQPPNHAAILEQYNGWLEHALESFKEDCRLFHEGEDLTRFYRQTDAGDFEYSEKELRKWLEQRWTAKITNRFGEI